MRSRRLKRVNRKWLFVKLFRTGGKFKGKVLKARYLRNTLGQIRLGFSVSGKTGNSVQRNLFKRRLRQFSVERDVNQGYDAVIFPLDKLANISWYELRRDMEELSRIAGEES